MSNHCISERFKLFETIAVGGYGVVSKAKSLRDEDKRIYAIKTIEHKNLSATERMRIEVEIDICKIVRHQKIVQFYEPIRTTAKTYIVMEYVAGGDLFNAIDLNKNKPFKEDIVKNVMKQLLIAVEYLHEIDIIFRDLKPENVLINEIPLTKNSSIKLCDFGLSVIKGKEPVTGALGSFYYIAPEALKVEPYTEKVDVWSLGVIGFALVEGFPPFCENDKESTLEKIRLHDFKYDFTIWINVTMHCKSFVDSLLTADPQVRPSCTKALKHAWFTIEIK